MSKVKIVGYGVGTLILNVRYCDSKSQPIKQELDDKLVQELDYLQGEARHVETAVATDWAFQDVLLFVEPHGAGKQWRWLPLRRALTARNRAIVNLFIDSGIRLNELVGLRLGDIDKSSRVILVHRKGNKWQQVPAHPQFK